MEIQSDVWNPAGAAVAAEGGDPAERALVLAVHRRQDGAFERLVKLYERGLLDYTRHLLGQAEDAQEVVQDAFVRAYRALTRQYDEERLESLRLRAWLYRVARNLAFNKQRGKRRQLEAPLTDGELSAAAVEQSVPTAGLERAQERARLDRALATLPRESRELIVLRFLEEMPYAELAATLGGSEAALRGKVFRALKRLRDALEPGGSPRGDER